VVRAHGGMIVIASVERKKALKLADEELLLLQPE
jgi:hypothetical protein